jgi:hypothetical protein
MLAGQRIVRMVISSEVRLDAPADARCHCTAVRQAFAHRMRVHRFAVDHAGGILRRAA